MSESRFRYLEIGGRVRRRVRATLEPTAAPVARETFRLAETIGSFGAELGQFSNPGGVATDTEGNLYVADSGNERIQKITPTGEVYGLGGPGLFVCPRGVVVDHSRFIYVVEQGGSRLQKFASRGQFVFAIGGPEAVQPRFASPTAIFLDNYHHIYIADTDNDRVTS